MKRLGKRSNGIRDMREQKKTKIALYFRRDSQWEMPKWFGFWESVKLRRWDHASSFTLFSVFFGSDLGEQLRFKSIEVNNRRQRQKDWRFFFSRMKKKDEKSVQEHSKLVQTDNITQHLSQSKNQNQPPPQPDLQIFHIILYTLSAASPFSYPAKSSHHQQ